MENTLTPQMITEIYASTSLGVAIMLAAAGLGSALGQIFQMPKKKIKSLVAIGSAGGIAAAFNTPIAA